MTHSGVFAVLSIFIAGGIFGLGCSDSEQEPVASGAGQDAGTVPAPGGEDAPTPGETPSEPPGDGEPDPDDGDDPDDEPSPSCSAGETRECNVDLLCTGISTCSSDGQFGPCECGPTTTELRGAIGATCTSDADCAGGGRCMTAEGNDFLGAGGPAGGYCTFDCAVTEDCTAHDPESICSPVGRDQSLICIRTCLSKSAEPGEAKCLNRTDVACVSVAAAGIEQFAVERQLGFCAPQCGSDEDCPAGRRCHRQGGICTDFPAPGAPSGSACQIDADCDGRACEDRVGGVGTCTASCVLGALSGCGFGANASPRDAGCVVPVVAAGGFSEGPGDRGLCLELCDVDSDCQQFDSGFGCRALNAGLSAFFGRAGACARGAASD